MPRQVYKVGDNSWSVGSFHDGVLLAGSSPKYYKTKKGAERALARMARN